MFYLYGTSHCHLCDEAEAILHIVAANKSVTWVKIDIAEDDALINSYGLKIPVLMAHPTNKELCWPFDLRQAETFIVENSINS